MTYKATVFVILALIPVAGLAQNALTTPAEIKSFTVQTQDFPKTARKLGAQGDTAVRYDIDEKGKVSSCTIAASSDNVDLDAATCRIVQRARFRPARDASGAPVASSANFAIAWRLLPADCPRPMAEYQFCVTP